MPKPIQSHLHRRCRPLWASAIGSALMLGSAFGSAANQDIPPGLVVAADNLPEHVAAYWTPERRQRAVPRDLYIDRQGRGLVRSTDGSLVIYGQKPRARPEKGDKGNNGGGKGGNGSSTDTDAPQVSNRLPAESAMLQEGIAHTFSAVVTDASGVKSVKVLITNESSGSEYSFDAGHTGGDVWEVTVTGLTAGKWSWQVVARDTVKRGNLVTTDSLSFSVAPKDTPTPDDNVSNSRWSLDGEIISAAGRIYFEMPSNEALSSWSGYVCSGTVVTESASDRSVILTAAHCVFDEVNGAFARRVLFIPDQDGTTAGSTDLDCTNDPMGCWVPSFGVVDVDWTTSIFPDNAPWDYAMYVVNDTVDSHQVGYSGVVGALDTVAGSLAVSFDLPAVDDGVDGSGTPDFTHALGYSYSDDPFFMYCAEDMTTIDSTNWWLPNCGLSDGSSGGPWIQQMNSLSGRAVMSVNSWGYSAQPGMAGPLLSGTSARCLYNLAQTYMFGSVSSADGQAGVIYADTCAQ